MKIRISRFSSFISVLALGLLVIATPAAGAAAAPAAAQQPSRPAVSGPQAKPAVTPGSQDAKQTAKLGPTNEINANNLNPATNAVSPLTGNVSGVDFQTFYNYCYRNLVYTTVNNTTSAVKYIHVEVYSQGTYHEIYTSVAAGGSYTYPAFYGIDGAYTAYLYVWNGSSYVYDEYKTGTNTCNVSVSRVYNAGGWVELKVQNLGTAYATQISTELAPYPGSGTYTGTQYDYPVAGGAAIYRWFQVGTQPYGIVSSTYGSFNSPALFYGDL